MSRTVEIELLQLRIPGLTRDEAQRAGKEVARRVSKALPAHGKRERLSLIDLRVRVPAGTPRDSPSVMLLRQDAVDLFPSRITKGSHRLHFLLFGPALFAFTKHI